MASPLRPDGLASEFIEDIEVPDVKPRSADPVGELKSRLYAQPKVAAQQLGDDLAQQGMQRAQAASRAASRAAYAPAPAAPAPGLAAKTAGAANSAKAGVAGMASRLRGMAGAAAPRAVLGKVVGAAGKIATPLGFAAGAAQSFNDSDETRGGYAAITPQTGNNAIDAVAPNALRVANNVGNALTGGYAERVGNVLSAALQGNNIKDAWNMGQEQPAVPVQAQQAPQQPGGPQVFDNAALAARGMNITPEQTQNQDPNGIQSLLRGMLSNGGSPQAQGAVIGNAGVGSQDPFDKLRADVMEAHGGGRVAKGTMAKKLMQIEEMRQGRQVSDQQNATSLRGQDQQAFAQAQANKLGVANTLADYDVAGQNAQSSRLRTQLDARKMQSELGEKGFERFQKLTDGLFQTTDKDGKATSDTQKAERFRSFIMGSDPQNGGGVELFNLPPQEQAAAIQNLRTAFDIQEERNASGGGFGATQQNTLDVPVETRDASISDVFNRGLSAKDYLYSNLPFTDNEVVQTQSGQSRLRSDYVGNDADRMRELQKYIR